MVDTGAAWVTVALGDREMRGAVLEISCRPLDAIAVASELAELPYVTVGVTTGRYQVFALILAPSLRGVSQLLTMDLPLSNGATDMNSYLFSDFYGGVVWRLGVIHPSRRLAFASQQNAHLGRSVP